MRTLGRGARPSPETLWDRHVVEHSENMGMYPASHPVSEPRTIRSFIAQSNAASNGPALLKCGCLFLPGEKSKLNCQGAKIFHLKTETLAGEF